MACKKEHRTKVNFWNLFLNVVSIYKNQLFMMEQNERIIEIMSANQDKINALSTQLDKATTEIKAEIDNLKSQSGAEQLDFSALESKVQALDDLNPDTPADGGQHAEPGQVDPTLPTEPTAPATGDAGQVSQ